MEKRALLWPVAGGGGQPNTWGPIKRHTPFRWVVTFLVPGHPVVFRWMRNQLKQKGTGWGDTQLRLILCQIAKIGNGVPRMKYPRAGGGPSVWKKQKWTTNHIQVETALEVNTFLRGTRACPQSEMMSFIDGTSPRVPSIQLQIAAFSLAPGVAFTAKRCRHLNTPLDNKQTYGQYGNHHRPDANPVAFILVPLPFCQFKRTATSCKYLRPMLIKYKWNSYVKCVSFIRRINYFFKKYDNFIERCYQVAVRLINPTLIPFGHCPFNEWMRGLVNFKYWGQTRTNIYSRSNSPSKKMSKKYWRRHSDVRCLPTVPCTWQWKATHTCLLPIDMQICIHGLKKVTFHSQKNNSSRCFLSTC